MSQRKLIEGASLATLKSQLVTVEALRKSAAAAESWSAVASMLRQEGELRGQIDAFETAGLVTLVDVPAKEVRRRLRDALDRLSERDRSWALAASGRVVADA